LRNLFGGGTFEARYNELSGSWTIRRRDAPRAAVLVTACNLSDDPDDRRRH
jgi:hypothetical protein